MRRAGMRLAFRNYLELGQTSILPHGSVFESEISWEGAWPRVSGFLEPRQSLKGLIAGAVIASLRGDWYSPSQCVLHESCVTLFLILCCCLIAKSCLSLLQPHGLQHTRLLCPWDFPGKNTGVSCHFLLQGVFLTQGLNLCLLHWQVNSLPLSHQRSSILCLCLCNLLTSSPRRISQWPFTLLVFHPWRVRGAERYPYLPPRKSEATGTQRPVFLTDNCSSI